MGLRPHPTLAEQEAAMRAALAGVTDQHVGEVLLRHGMRLKSLRLLPENNPEVPGRLFNNNAIFLVVAFGAAQHGGETELILRISNAHAWRACRHTENEVSVLQWLAKHHVPLTPRVVDFSCDPATSLLGCEYILMERLPGDSLKEQWPGFGEEERMSYIQQLKDWLGTLQAVPRPPGGGGPLASLRHTAAGIVADRPVVLVDGPELTEASREGFAAYAAAILGDTVARLEADRDPRRGALATELRRVLHDHVEPYRVAYEAHGTPSEYLRLCHNDLHLGNLLCSGGKLTGVIDWEGAAWAFTDQDCLDFLESRGAADERFDDGGSGLPVAPGAQERRGIMALLREAPGLHFFNATWYGASQDEHERQLASENEGRNAEAALRKAIAELDRSRAG